VRGIRAFLRVIFIYLVKGNRGGASTSEEEVEGEQLTKPLSWWEGVMSRGGPEGRL